ncbi:MAG: hypothetical protein KAI27_01915 [Rhodospirillaceae bacterium]|nr:hypothetical protein [Rhodospirillaceae bacterium]
MIKKMFYHSIFSALIIGVLAGGYGVTLGSNLEPTQNASHDRDHDHDHDHWGDG